MEKQLFIYNSLSRKKEEFKALNPPHVGMYVCGPTVYGDAHLGHARPAITFDILFRYLQHLDYKVRYVRNITDVGHLENDMDDGEDKIAKRARLESLEPMEVVQYYTNSYHRSMRQLNVLDPSIEPQASGHIIEQQQFIDRILERGFAYEKNGSVYFDVKKYNKKYKYGVLSGRVLEDLQSNTRELDGQDEKKNPFDFALWKKASPEHLMSWPSKWSIGFPGWHLECSTMGTKYLGDEFDIHGGGLDLLFPHHECEIAQSTAVHGKSSVRYWMHNNMITLNGQKMGKSLGNAVSLDDFFSGKHPLLEKAYSPMSVRFFMLQAHYRSPLDFSNQALQASEIGLEKLFRGMETLEKIQPSGKSDIDYKQFESKCYQALNDDLNTPILISYLFDGLKQINALAEGKASINSVDLDNLKKLYKNFVEDILGLKKEDSGKGSELTADLIETILSIRQEAKLQNDFETSDKIRNALTSLGIEIKDKIDGFDWELSTTLKNKNMNYLIMLGSDMFYGTNGVLSVQVNNKFVNFFKIREIHRVRSKGSYLAVDCDIKDNDNVREVKLFKSKPVTQNDNVIASFDLRETIVKRQNGSVIIKIEQLELNNIPLVEFEPVKKTLSGFPSTMIGDIKQNLNSITIDAVIKITGDFYAGQYHLVIGDDYSSIGGITMGGNLKIGSGGIELTDNGFSL